HAETTNCADVTLSSSPSTVHRGQTETVSGSVTNCSNHAETIGVRLAVTGPAGTACAGPFVERQKVTLAAGQTISRSESFQAPPCLGSYKIVLAARDASGVLDRASTTFTVVA